VQDPADSDDERQLVAVAPQELEASLYPATQALQVLAEAQVLQPEPAESQAVQVLAVESNHFPLAQERQAEVPAAEQVKQGEVQAVQAPEAKK